MYVQTLKLKILHILSQAVYDCEHYAVLVRFPLVFDHFVWPRDWVNLARLKTASRIQFSAFFRRLAFPLMPSLALSPKLAIDVDARCK